MRTDETINAIENNPVVLMDRIQGEDATDMQQADITAITFRVFQYNSEAEARTDTTGVEVSTFGTLTVGSVIFDTLQTDARWGADTEGYNFRFTLPGARLPAGGKWYRVEVLIDPSAGGEEDFILDPYIIYAKPRAGSSDAS